MLAASAMENIACCSWPDPARRGRRDLSARRAGSPIASDVGFSQLGGSSTLWAILDHPRRGETWIRPPSVAKASEGARGSSASSMVSQISPVLRPVAVLVERIGHLLLVGLAFGEGSSVPRSNQGKSVRGMPRRGYRRNRLCHHSAHKHGMRAEVQSLLLAKS